MSKKIGFVLASNRNKMLASTRISVLNMFPYLVARNYLPSVLFEPENTTETPDVSGLVDDVLEQGIDIVYFQKVHGSSVLNAVADLKTKGVKTVYGVCDLIENEMTEITNATITVTEYIKALYSPRFHKKIFVVHDGIEKPDVYKKSYSNNYGSRKTPIRLGFVTGSTMFRIPVLNKPPSYTRVDVVGRFPKAPNILGTVKDKYYKVQSQNTYRDKLAVATSNFSSRFNAINWQLETVHAHLVDCDIGIIPVDMSRDLIPGQSKSWWQVKSENRLTLLMAMGLPVIASPVPSYHGIIEQGVNGYIASSREEWLHHLNELRSPELRKSIGQSARGKVIVHYSKEAQADKLVQVLTHLLD